MRKYLYLAACSGLIGVGLGAFGAHGLKVTLAERGMTSAWETAVLYQFIHTVAVLAVTLNALGATSPKAFANWLCRSCFSWSVGILLFSGSLYWLALGGPKWLGPITPLGGIAFMLGWGFLLVGAVKSQNPGNS